MEYILYAFVWITICIETRRLIGRTHIFKDAALYYIRQSSTCRALTVSQLLMSNFGVMMSGCFYLRSYQLEGTVWWCWVADKAIRSQNAFLKELVTSLMVTSNLVIQFWKENKSSHQNATVAICWGTDNFGRGSELPSNMSSMLPNEKESSSQPGMLCPPLG